jgi:hypothetical protein
LRIVHFIDCPCHPWRTFFFSPWLDLTCQCHTRLILLPTMNQVVGSNTCFKQ